MNSINLHIKNLTKLLLIGAVLFVFCSLISNKITKCVTAKTNNICQADLAKNMFAQADNQLKPESPDYLLVDTACAKAAIPPVAVTPQLLGVIVGDSQAIEEANRKSIIEYEVEGDETIAGLAEKFNISAETIAWANNISKSARLSKGQQLIIPPVSGIVHLVASGDTMTKISEKYQANSENIIAYNELSGENDIFIGDMLIVPDGKMPVAPKPSSNGNANNLVQNNGVSLPNSYFLCPVGAACRKSQGRHFYNAVDLTAGCGAPIYAAASGTVVKAKIGGWNGGAGNNITLSHFGGTIVTHYYHLQSISVSAGQEVKKGDVIGFMGTTGKSTGCHLHFEVICAANPFTK